MENGANLNQHPNWSYWLILEFSASFSKLPTSKSPSLKQTRKRMLPTASKWISGCQVSVAQPPFSYSPLSMAGEKIWSKQSSIKSLIMSHRTGTSYRFDFPAQFSRYSPGTCIFCLWFSHISPLVAKTYRVWALPACCWEFSLKFDTPCSKCLVSIHVPLQGYGLHFEAKLFFNQLLNSIHPPIFCKA